MPSHLPLRLPAVPLPLVGGLPHIARPRLHFTRVPFRLRCRYRCTGWVCCPRRYRYVVRIYRATFGYDFTAGVTGRSPVVVTDVVDCALTVVGGLRPGQPLHLFG